MTPTQPAAGEQVETALKALVRKYVRTDSDTEKTQQYSAMRRLHWYWLGEQYLRRVPYGDNGVDWKPINGLWTSTNQPQDNRAYLYYTNEIRGYGRKFISVCAQQAPTIKGTPNKEDNEDHVVLARKADIVARSLYQLWDIERWNAYIFLTFWKAGPAFARVRWVPNRKKYGSTTLDVMGMEKQPDGPGAMRCIQCGAETPVEGDMPPAACPYCQTPFAPEDYQEPQMVDVPVKQGQVQYANGCAEMEILNSMYVSTPFSIRSISETPWLKYQKNMNPAVVLASYREKALADPSKEQIYKKLREKLSSGGEGGQGTDSTDASYTQKVATSYNGLDYGHNDNFWVWEEVYLRANMLEYITDSETRESLGEEYENGIKITFVNGDYVEHEPADIDEEWVAAAPETYETLYADPLAKDLISSQDFSNCILNITAETWERNIPQTLANVEMISVREQTANRLPASIIPVRPKQGMRLSDAVERLPQSVPDPQSHEFSAAWREHAVQGVGITPAIYGGGPKEQTAYAANLKRNQALIQLSMSIKAARWLLAQSLQLGVKCQAKFSNGRVPSAWAPATEADQMDLADLLQGGWHMSPEDSMPISPGEERAAILELIEKVGQNPQLMDLFNFNDPDNIDEVANIVGIPDWNVKNQESNRKFRSTLRRLLQGQPTEGPPTMDPMTGQMMPGELQPSIPADQFEDDHQFMALSTQLWAQGEEAEIVRQSKPAAYANVIAWGKAHAMMIPPPPPTDGGEAGPPPAGPVGPPQKDPNAPPQQPPQPQ